VPAEAAEFARGIASVYFEPLWIFHRAELEVAQLTDLAGRRIQIGAEGSGTRTVATALLAANGVDAGGATLLELPAEAVAEQLLAGELDGVFAVSSPRSATVARLMEAEGQGVSCSTSSATSPTNASSPTSPTSCWPGACSTSSATCRTARSTSCPPPRR
jgi:TRAP-type uncharacterized transport system substrate-binding protein